MSNLGPKTHRAMQQIKPKKPSVAERDDNGRVVKYHCTRCERSYKEQASNFIVSHSHIYENNGRYATVCWECINEMYRHYLEKMGNDREVVRRICMMFDIYYSDDVLETAKQSIRPKGLMFTYTMLVAHRKYNGMTFDDTISEENIVSHTDVRFADDVEEFTPSEYVVTQEMVRFWGGGLTPDFYADIEQRLAFWCGEDFDKEYNDYDAGEIAVIKQICILETQINRAVGRGESAEKLVNSLNSFLGSGNFKPSQKTKDDKAAMNELNDMTMGQWIEYIEKTKPITEPVDEFKDVDGIGKHIAAWFLGPLCKSLGINGNNPLIEAYEEAVEKYSVERPEYDGEDEETTFTEILKRARSGGVDNE